MGILVTRPGAGMKAAAREESAMDSTQRFSTRVEAYVKYRPGYPAAMLDFLARELAKRIENELEYPGQIKVHVLRETKVVEYAK